MLLTLKQPLLCSELFCVNRQLLWITAKTTTFGTRLLTQRVSFYVLIPTESFLRRPRNNATFWDFLTKQFLFSEILVRVMLKFQSQFHVKEDYPKLTSIIRKLSRASLSRMKKLLPISGNFLENVMVEYKSFKSLLSVEALLKMNWNFQRNFSLMLQSEVCGCLGK